MKKDDTHSEVSFQKIQQINKRITNKMVRKSKL